MACQAVFYQQGANFTVKIDHGLGAGVYSSQHEGQNKRCKDALHVKVLLAPIRVGGTSILQCFKFAGAGMPIQHYFSWRNQVLPLRTIDFMGPLWLCGRSFLIG